MEWQVQILEEGPYKANCDGYNLDIDIFSEEPVQLKKHLLEAAFNGCFIEASLKPGVIKHRFKDKDNWITI